MKAKIWDPEEVLQWIRTQETPKNCTLQMLARRLALLILLVTGQRPQVLPALRLSSKTVIQDVVIFELKNVDLKQGRQGYVVPSVILKQFTDKRICVVEHLNEYLDRTKENRNNVDSLFMTTVKPYHAATLNTISGWIKKLLIEADIDVKLATAGSARSASTSKAVEAGAPIDTILSSAGWSNCSTFARFYHKEVVSKKC